MSIRIGVYELFAYTIPGGFYILTTLYLLASFGVISIDFQMITSISVAAFLVLTVLAYIAGMVFDPIAKNIWYRFFLPDDVSEQAYDDFKANQKELDIKFHSKDWYILLAYLKQANIEIAAEVEKFNTSRMLLRNVSFCFALLSIGSIVQFFVYNYYIWSIVLFLVFLMLSIVAGKQSAKFHRWFFSSVFQSFVCLGLKTEHFIGIKPPITKKIEKVE